MKRIMSIVLAISLLLITPLTVNAATATLNAIQFLVNGELKSVPAAYLINGTNYLQLRGLAAILSGTAAQFNVTWDDVYSYPGIETGKPYTTSEDRYQLVQTVEAGNNGEGFWIYRDGQLNGDFYDVWYIRDPAEHNYVGIRAFAKWLNGTASQFNVYWDETMGQVVIEPGAYYTGVNPNYVGNAPNIEMVHINAGIYPVWETDVTLTNGFNIGKYEVTQEQWKAVMGINPSYFDGSDDDWVGLVPVEFPDGSWALIFDLIRSSGFISKGPVPGEVQEKRPVESVSFYDALVFCNKLSMLSNLTPVYSISGSTNPKDWGIAPEKNNEIWNAVVCDWNANGYRLPTAAQWYIASRAGQNYDEWLNGKTLGDFAWYINNSGVVVALDPEGFTHEVGKREPNPWGIYDMYGNVEEWNWDFYYNRFPFTDTDPKGPDAFFADSGRRDYSGGSCDSDNTTLGQINWSHKADIRTKYVGLRLVRNDDNYKAVIVADKGDPIGISIGAYPTKKVYKVGGRFEMTGMVVNLKYADGTVEKAERPAVDFVTSDGVWLALGRPFTMKGTKKINVTCKVGTLECIGMYEVEVK